MGTYPHGSRCRNHTPCGGHRPRVDDRRAMKAIFFKLPTGCPWHALQATDPVPAGPRIVAARPGWQRACVWRGIDTGWLRTTRSRASTGSGWRGTGSWPRPPSGEKDREAPHRSGELGTKWSLRTDGGGVPIGLAVGGTNRPDFTMAHATREQAWGAAGAGAWAAAGGVFRSRLWRRSPCVADRLWLHGTHPDRWGRSEGA